MFNQKKLRNMDEQLILGRRDSNSLLLSPPEQMQEMSAQWLLQQRGLSSH